MESLIYIKPTQLTQFKFFMISKRKLFEIKYIINLIKKLIQNSPKYHILP